MVEKKYGKTFLTEECLKEKASTSEALFYKQATINCLIFLNCLNILHQDYIQKLPSLL
jgi:hypothetical protein